MCRWVTQIAPSRYRSRCRNWPLTLTVSILTGRPSTVFLRHNISRLGLSFPITWLDWCPRFWNRNKTTSINHYILRLGLFFPNTWFNSCPWLWHRNEQRSITRTLLKLSLPVLLFILLLQLHFCISNCCSRCNLCSSFFSLPTHAAALIAFSVVLTAFSAVLSAIVALLIFFLQEYTALTLGLGTPSWTRHANFTEF